MAAKSRVFITGPPGVGKTTLVIDVLDKLRKAHPSEIRIHGFYTREMRNANGERAGFEAVIVDGRTAPLATSLLSSSRPSVPAGSMPKVGKYSVNVAQFESLVLPQLEVDPQETADCDASELFVIDEVGKMELLSYAFFPAVWKVLDSTAAAVLGTIPVPKHGREVPEVERIKRRPDVAVCTLTKNNRDTMAKAVLSHVTSLLRK